MIKITNIKTEEEKSIMIAYLLTKAYPVGMTAKLKYNFKKKAENFSIENNQLYFTTAGIKYKYICDFNYESIKAVCDKYHLPSHMGRNALREAINKEYIGISTNFIYSYVKMCFS
ncbi:hypothetical protein CDIK_3732 [Cucumispora dikerogammari]|nr:hypothetical protein CDIK_3732 [Cucumispora dikerogammari]